MAKMPCCGQLMLVAVGEDYVPLAVGCYQEDVFLSRPDVGLHAFLVELPFVGEPVLMGSVQRVGGEKEFSSTCVFGVGEQGLCSSFIGAHDVHALGREILAEVIVLIREHYG